MKKNIIRSGAAIAVAGVSVTAAVGSQSKVSPQDSSWYVTAYALQHTEEFDPLAQDLKASKDQKALEDRLASIIENIKQKGLSTELSLQTNRVCGDLFVGVKSPEGEVQAVLFVRIEKTVSLFKSLVSRFGASPYSVDRGQIAVI